jgi:large conductance mechanosensitive channel
MGARPNVLSTREGEVKSILAEFKAFLMQGNLVLLAVAFVIGTAFAALVGAFVTDWVTPIIGAIFGGKGPFGNLKFTLHNSDFLYGHFIDAAITFVAIAAAVFFLVVRPYQAYMARRGPAEEAVTLTPDQQLLTEIRDLLKARS